jgi:hypothetical protein
MDSAVKKILILSANPKDTSPLRLGEEAREIESALQRAKNRDKFEIVSKWAVRVEDLRRALLDCKPNIVHFCGHGAGTEGLALEDNSGVTQLVSSESIANLFELFCGTVECVLLNACYSEAQAQAIHRHINYVIGMNQPIGDMAAIEFATGFYDALGAGESYEYAFKMGCTSIHLKGSPEYLTPVLKSRPSSVAPVHASRSVDFDNDIYISYANIDNQPLSESQSGWISDFHRVLEIRLAQLRGEKARICRSLKLQENDYFDDKIVVQFPKVALLVSVLSPRYLKSQWCIKELQEFCKSAEETGGIRVAGNKSRIFKVIKTPVPLEQQPQELKSLLSYEFYEMGQTGRPQEFNRIFGFESEKKYWAKLEDLAYDIYQLLETFQPMKVEEASPIVNSVKSTGTTIYLAETTFDLNEARDKIRRELQQRGYIIVPGQSLPLNPDFPGVVRENLENCKLSIHLMGQRYGIIPEGLEQSVVELQYSLAKAYKQQNSEFSYLVWTPSELNVLETRQSEFIELLQDDAELLQTSLEDFKTIIQDKLNPRQASSEPRVTFEGPTQVYLICDRRDLDTIEPLEEYLWSQNLEVLPSMFEGDEAEVRQYHQESLRDCDAVLIYYGQGNELWLRTKLRELQKAAGYGRTKPMLAIAVYVAGPETNQKQRFRTHQAMVIKNFEEFSPHALEPFRVQLTQRQGGLQ